MLLKKLNHFEGDGFEPSSGFVFGFSFGAQLAINAGRDFGGQLNAIDGIVFISRVHKYGKKMYFNFI